MSTFSIPKVNISLSIIIFLVFFLGNNVLSAYNIPHQLYTLSIVLLCLINLIPSFHKKIHKNGSLRNLLFFLTIYWAWKVFNGGEGSIMIGIIVFLPPYIYLCFINSRQQPFFVLASTNPSLSSSFVPMTSFLLLSLIMKQTSKM